MSIVERTSIPDLETKREMLARRLRQAAGEKAQLPLSFAQQRLWFLDQLEPDSALYNIGTVAKFFGELNVDWLERALQVVIDRHDALRTRFETEDGTPRQVIGTSGFRLLFADFSTLPVSRRESEITRVTDETVRKPFRLSSDLLLRGTLLKTAETEHLLVLCVHHIIADEWSLKVLFTELGACYEAYATRKEHNLQPLSIQYSDYTRWQRARLRDDVFGKQMEFWRKRLGGTFPVTDLGEAQKHPKTVSFKGAIAERPLGRELSQSVRSCAMRHEATPFMVLLSAFKALIFRYTRQQDVVVGSPFAGRTRVETESLIGFFVNTLPLRTRVTGDMTGQELITSIKETALGAQVNQDLPFERIVEELQPERSLSHMPFTRLMFVVQSAMVETLDWPGLTVHLREVHTGTAKFDLTLVVQDTAAGLVAKVEYNVALFEREVVKRLLGHYENLLQAIVASPETTISKLPLLKAEEWKEISTWGEHRVDYPRDKTIHQVFESQAQSFPDRIAAVFGSQSITYAELNARANQLASALRQSGVGTDVPVLVCLRRSPELIVAVLAVLKAGGAYVPADPGYPRERLSFMVADTNAPVLLTEQALLSRLPAGNAKVLCLDADWEFIARESRENLSLNTGPDNLAYIMYTSGSTGVPKGVAIPHRAVNRLVLNPSWIQLGAHSRVAQVSNASFDAATFEIWGALLNGGQLVGISQNVALSPADFARELRERSITDMFLTAALFNQLAAEAPGAFETMHTLLAGGEALDPKWVRAVLGNRRPKRLMNGYGPTENTTFTCCHLIESCPEQVTNVPIGRPISNTSVYILDEDMEPVPIGVAGELHAGGDGLARGYWNRPELTAEKFVPNPFGPSADLLYKTGDLARWLPDGTIEFLGRMDNQIKLRGFRIELGEIETVLSRHPHVRECVVNVSGTNSATRRLIGYVVPVRGQSPKVNELRSFLLERVPEFMVPSAFICLEAMPLTPNGKVDRRALPEPDQTRPDFEKKYVRPMDAVEARLVEIWEGVLKVKPIGVEDKFFDLGGHSLLAVQVLSRIEKAFGRKLRLSTIFQTPTIRQLAAIVREESAESPSNRTSSLVAIQPEGTKTPLFLVHGAGGGMFWGYVNLSRHLGKGQPVYGFKSRGLDGKEEIDSIPELAAQYVTDLRTVQPHGPYYLGGYCFGGNVAFEMSRQLHEAGESVAVLALLNCAPPNSRYMRIPWSFRWAMRLARNMVYWGRYFLSWSSSQRREFFRWKLGRLARRLHKQAPCENRGRLEASNLVDLSGYTDEQRMVWEAHINALVNFHPRPFPGKVHLFRSPGHPLWCSFDADYGWGDYARNGVEIIIVPGAHEKILDEPCVARTAEQLMEVLNHAQPAEARTRKVLTPHMEVFRGLLVNTALFWMGTNGELLSGEDLGQGATSLAMLLNQVGALRKTAARTGPHMDHEPELRVLDEPSRMQVERVILDHQTASGFQELSVRLGIPPAALMLAVTKVLLLRYAPEHDSGASLMPLAANPGSGKAVCSVHKNILSLDSDLNTAFSQLALQSASASGELENAAVAFEIAFGDDTSARETQIVALRLTLESNSNSLEGRIEYDPTHFSPGSVQRLLVHWRTLLTGALREPECPVGKLPLVGPEERETIFKVWNNTAQAFPLATTYSEQFQAQVRKNPEAPAVVWSQGQWTYSELNRRSYQMARRLRDAGITSGSLVAICLERSPELMATFLAVWKTGAAYVPLDPSYPKERVAFMLKDSQARVIITQARYLEHLPGGEREIICLDNPVQKDRIASYEGADIPVTGNPDDAAYVIYTSGSTGAPKGVVIAQRSLLNHGHACKMLYNLRPEDRVLQFAAISFDISIEEIFPTWLAGASIVLRSDEAISSIPRFTEFLETHRISILNLPTAYWHELVNGMKMAALPACLRLVVIGGEKASDDAFRKWKELVSSRVQLINSYGPTETTVTATAEIPEPAADKLSIGRPFPNTCIVILDSNLQLVPAGVVGELCIGGLGLAKGYLGKDKLTAEKFVPNPFPGELRTERIYRTGDLARFLEDGRIEFVGRRDEQVKIRGFRIELGEIEAVLRNHPAVGEAIVVAREDQPGRKRLAAYYLPAAGASVTSKQLVAFLKGRLPSHMVPGAFTPLTELPKTPAGKIDRRSLPAPESGRPQLDTEFVPPSTPVEKALGQIWSEVLGMDQIGVADNFFELGGDSLLATRVLSRIRESMRAEVSMAELFANPDIAALAKHLVEQGQRFVFDPGLVGVAEDSSAPLTERERRIWFLDEFDPDQSAYNLPLGLRLQGPLQIEVLKESIKIIAGRHEALRTVFPEVNGEPVRLVCQVSSVQLEFRDLAEEGAMHGIAQAMLIAAQEAKRSHVCARPMLRAILIRIEPEDHLLVLVTHSIASDMGSLRLLYNELTAVYNARATERPNPLPPLTYSYQEIVNAAKIKSADEARARVFWRTELAGTPPLLELPTDYPRPGFHTDDGARHPLRIAPGAWHRLLGFARDLDCDPFVVLLAAFSSVLYRYSSATDLVVGTNISTRRAFGAEQFFGGFENEVALRCNFEDALTFRALVERLKEKWSAVREHGLLPFDDVLAEVLPPRDPSHTPIFQVKLTCDEEPMPKSTAGQVAFTPFALENHTAKLDLHLHFTNLGDCADGWVDYSTRLFEPDRIARFGEHLQTFIAAALYQPDREIQAMPLLPDPEMRILEEWNDTRKPYPAGASLYDLFAKQAELTPLAEAIIDGEERLSYSLLHSAAAAVSRQLVETGVQPGDLVGICMERSWEMVAAMLGVFKAGAAYVPLDPGYPLERLNFMLKDCNAKLVLTEHKLLGTLTFGEVKTLCIENIHFPRVCGDVPVNQDLPAGSPAQGDRLAYVIYTSGSTGVPKGVALNHRGAVALAWWARDVFSSDELSGVLASTSICFDLSVFELFVPLCTGGRVILAENALTLHGLPAAHEVRLINTVPSAMRELLSARAIPKEVLTINLAGEPLPTSLVDQIYGQTSVRNVYDLYGPTETTTYSTWALRQPGELPTIGRPLANETVYILDAKWQLVPIGVPGELCIGGDGLARGYLGEAELTAQRFITPCSLPEKRVYRTGDLARWRRDGKLEYLGRLDHQVKIRGFRIELGEIEEVVKTHPSVAAAVALACEDRTGGKQLVVYIVPKAKHGDLPRELRRSLAEKLPAHMMPAHFIVLAQLPLTPNGKIDRKALPAPEPVVPSVAGQRSRSELEEQLAEVWKTALGLSELPGVSDNFFELGGHSLLAMRVCSRIREELRVDLPLRVLFQAPTIEALADRITSRQWGRASVASPPIQRADRNSDLPVSFVQERLWFLDQIDPGGNAYNVPWAVRLRGQLDLAGLQHALDQIVVRHEILRTSLVYQDGLRQKIAPELSCSIEFQDLSAESGDLESKAAALVTAEARRPFDLAAAPLMRAKLFRVAPADHIFSVVMHHAISDGWSLTLLSRELEAFYNCRRNEAEVADLPELTLQYADYSCWQRNWMHGAVLQQQLTYWKTTLAGAPTALDLPNDHVPDHLGNAGETREVFLSTETLARVSGLSQTESATPYIVLMTALAITLRQWTGQEDLVIGTVVAGRNRGELEHLIGCFMNFLPIRARFNDAKSAHDVLRRIRHSVLDGQTHQDCPFERMVEALNPERRQNENPLYNVAFLYQNFPPTAFEADQLSAATYPVTTGTALLDLRFEAEPRDEGLVVSCEYKTGLFEASTIDALLASLVKTIDLLLSDSRVPLAAFQVTPELAAQARSARERQHQETFNIASTFTAEPLEDPLRHWMRELGVPAAVHFAPYNQVFQQLLDAGSLLRTNSGGLNILLIRLEDWQASEGRRAAIDRAVGDFLVAVRTASTSMAVPLLVCFCPPSAKVQNSPGMPEFLAQTEERLASELDALNGVYTVKSRSIFALYPVANYYDASSDALGSVPYTPVFFTGLATVVARQHHAIKRPSCKVIALDCDNTLWSGVCGEEGVQGIRADGAWKALQEFMVAQHKAGRLLCLCSKNNEEDVEAVFAKRIEMPLKRCHFTAVKLNWSRKSDNLKALANELNLGLDSFVFLDDNPVECAEVEANCPEVLTLQLPEDPARFESFLKHCWVFDRLKVTDEDRRRSEMYQQNAQRERLRSEGMSLAEFLQDLDLRIQIETMTRAQLARVAQLTQRTNQFNVTTRRRSETQMLALSSTHEILTVQVSDRFGDYGLVGVIIFCASDRTLKVDTLLLSCRVLGRGVEHRIVNRLGNIARERRLLAVEIPYLKTAKNKPAHDFLQSIGEDYSGASAEGTIFKLPAGYAADLSLETASTTLSPASPAALGGGVVPEVGNSRKFTRCRRIALELADPEQIHSHFEARAQTRVSRRHDYAAPHTGMERKLCQLWQNLLRVDRVGIRDNFFDLGGHSLLAVRLFAEIEKTTGRKYPLITLFQAPTVEQLARVLDQNKAGTVQNLLVPIQPNGNRPPLFLVHGAGGDVLWGYANLAAHLGNDQPVYGIKSRGQTGQEEFSDLGKMADFYVGVLLEFQPEGPYYLGGYCFGGNVAYEMARLLRQRGHEVAMVALIDSSPSNAGYEQLAWWRPYRFAKNLYYWLEDFAALKPEDRRNFFLRKGKALFRKIRRCLSKTDTGDNVDIEDVIDPGYFPENELKLWQCHLNALVRHVEKPYEGPVILLRTRGQPIFCSFEDDFGWSRLVSGELSLHSIPGSHENIFIEPHVQVLARVLESCLDKTQPGAGIPSDLPLNN